MILEKGIKRHLNLLVLIAAQKIKVSCTVYTSRLSLHFLELSVNRINRNNLYD